MSLRHVAAFLDHLGAPFRPAPVRRYPDAELFDVEAFDRGIAEVQAIQARNRATLDAIEGWLNAQEKDAA